ncbi:MAG: cysteine synthase family protein [Clostridiales bacterium]|nr:cysteine synthase family protein [Clostridiales bacterium]
MSVLDLIGNTPLLELTRITRGSGSGARIFAKAEYTNPSGSVKDRAAKAMVEDGLKTGLLSAGKTLIDATSGNTGIAYAMLGAALGFPVKIYLPQNASPERKQILRSYGAEIVETDPLESSDGAYLAVAEAYAADPDGYFFPNQYNNPANPKAHYDGTGAEIWAQTGGGVTHFIAGMGTSGTFMGVSRRLKAHNPAVKVIAVQPDSPFHGIEGTKHMASTLKPGICDEAVADGTLTVSTEAAYATARRLAKEEGLFVGISSGANVRAALDLAKTLDGRAVVVTILCDGGTRYLSDSFWDEGER